MDGKQFLNTWPAWKEFEPGMMALVIDGILKTAREEGMAEAAKIAAAHDPDDDGLDSACRDIAREIFRAARKAGA